LRRLIKIQALKLPMSMFSTYFLLLVIDHDVLHK